MSGGSYNYLFTKDVDDLVQSASDLREMATRLAGLGYAEDAATETEELLTIVNQFRVRAQVRISRLADVWHAVEWWDSCDAGEEGVKKAVAAYREGE